MKTVAISKYKLRKIYNNNYTKAIIENEYQLRKFIYNKFLITIIKTIFSRKKKIPYVLYKYHRMNN